MAQNKEQREIEIVLNGSKVNASLKEMGASAALMNAQLRKMATDDPGRKKLAEDYTALRGRITEVRNELYGVEKASLAAKLGLNDMGGIMKTVLGTAGGFMLAGGVEGMLTGVIGWFSGASDAAKEFEKSVSSLESLTGASEQDLEYYKEQAALIGETSTLSGAQAVEAFKLIGSAKPDLLETKEALAAVTAEAVVLAEAAETDLPAAAQAMTGALNQFQLPAEDASRVINALAAGSKAGAANIPEISDSIDKFGTAAAAFNVTFEESVGLVETLAEYNMKGAESGTALRNVLSKMASAKALPASALEELEKFSVDIEVISDKSIPMNERLREFSKISGDATALTKVFGAENQIAGGIILGNVDKFEKLTEAVTGTNTAYEQQAINTDNLEGDTKALDSVVESYAITIGSKLNVAKRAGVQLLTQFLLILKETPRFIKENQDLFYMLGIAIVALNAANIKTAASTLYHNAVEKGRAIATRTSAAAQWLLNAAMTANPIGLVVGAVAALVGGFILLYNRSEAVRGGMAGLGRAFMEILSIAGDIALFLMNPIKNAGKIAEIMNSGERLGKAFSDGYNDKIASEKVEAEKKEAVEHEKKKQEAEKKGEEVGAATNKGDEKAKKERLKKEKEHQDKLNKAREEYARASEKSELELAKLKVEIMGKGIDQTLAKLKLHHDQEMAELEKQKQATLANIATTEEEKQTLLENYRQQQELREQEYQEQVRVAKAEEEQRKREEDLTKLEEEEQLRMERLQNQFLTTLTAEFDQEQARLELQKSFLQQRLAILEEAGLGETTQALKFKNAMLKIDKDLADGKTRNAERTAKAKKEIETIIMSNAMESFKMGIELLGKETQARGVAMAAFKSFSLGKIGVDVVEEIQAIWKTANQNPLNAIVPGAGTAIAVVKTAAAVGRAAGAAKQIHAQQFAKGGMTKGGKTIPMVEVNGMWEMLSGHSGGSIGAFANGGWVNDAQLGLIGEAGRELVIPNWMVESPKYANLVGYLEAERQKGVKAFAGGGMTVDAASPVPVPADENRPLSKFEQQLLQEVRELKEEVFTWPRQLEVHNNVGDTRDKMKQLNDLEEKAFG
ncbi:phage tail tape measure protein [Pontibacter beigongshangensis]|uniref:phage tail tape measure protein n=1 Tax=Pontibacter beigongshangensis TaxID=2574733 RepID=UPI00165072CA|nr:phage tail tape measure protein [Pontibacter beigongshangensis]